MDDPHIATVGSGLLGVCWKRARCCRMLCQHENGVAASGAASLFDARQPAVDRDENCNAMIVQTKNEQLAAAVFNAKAQHTQGRSLQSFLASLTAAGAIFGVEILLFLLLRTKLPGI